MGRVKVATSETQLHWIKWDLVSLGTGVQGGTSKLTVTFPSLRGGGRGFICLSQVCISLHPLGLCFSPLRRNFDLVLSPSLPPFLPIVSQSLSLHLSQSNSISPTVPQSLLPHLPRSPSLSLRSLHLFRSPSLSPPHPRTLTSGSLGARACRPGRGLERGKLQAHATGARGGRQGRAGGAARSPRAGRRARAGGGGGWRRPAARELAC